MAKSLFINGKTYIYDDNGKLFQTVEGDQTRSPEFFAPTGPRLKVSPGSSAASNNLTGDLITDAATQIPLMAIPGSGAGPALARGAASLLSGLFTDRMINKLQG